MAIPIKPKNLTNIIAYEGDKIEIPDSTAPDSGQPSIASGWPRITSLPVTAGGVAPSREGFNGLFNLLSQHLFYQQSGCLYSWSDKLSYPIGAVIKGTNGAIYIATANSGVDYAGIGAKDPVSSPTFWAPLLVGNAVPVTAGGTGAMSAAAARTNLGVGSAGTLTAGTAAGQVPVYGAGQTLTGIVDSVKIQTGKWFESTLPYAIYFYEVADTTLNNLPDPNCYVYVSSTSGNRNIAIAYGYAFDQPRIWINTKHWTEGTPGWIGWHTIFTDQSIVPVINGGTGNNNGKAKTVETIDNATGGTILSSLFIKYLAGMPAAVYGNGSIELFGIPTFLDFHYGDDKKDFTARVSCEDTSGDISMSGSLRLGKPMGIASGGTGRTDGAPLFPSFSQWVPLNSVNIGAGVTLPSGGGSWAYVVFKILASTGGVSEAGAGVQNSGYAINGEINMVLRGFAWKIK